MNSPRATSWMIAAGFGLVGLINLVPISGVLGAPILSRLYGFETDDPALLILLRHRAVLLGAIGALMLAAAWHAPWRSLAGALGLTSMASYVALVWVTPEVSVALQRIAWVDLAAIAVLVAVCWLHHRARHVWLGAASLKPVQP